MLFVCWLKKKDQDNEKNDNVFCENKQAMTVRNTHILQWKFDKYSNWQIKRKLGVLSAAHIPGPMQFYWK